MYVSQVMNLIVAKGIGGGDEDGEDGPAEHRCPITLQLVVDPTSLYDSDCLENPNLGHTFEGRVIEHHFEPGKEGLPSVQDLPEQAPAGPKLHAQAQHCQMALQPRSQVSLQLDILSTDLAFDMCQPCSLG